METAALDAENRGDERARSRTAAHRRDSLLLFVACTLMWTANSMYLINMPLARGARAAAAGAAGQDIDERRRQAEIPSCARRQRRSTAANAA